MTIWRELTEACLEDSGCADGGESVQQAFGVIVPVALVIGLVGLVFLALRHRRGKT